MKNIPRYGFWFMLVGMFFLFLFDPIVAGATPEQDEGFIEKNEVEDSEQSSLGENWLNSKSVEPNNTPFKIFLDPGHGGKDPGAQSGGLNEKDVALDIALKTKQILDQEYLNVETKMSRSTDKAVELEDRSAMANNWGADYFLSFHLNSFNGTASGFESFIYNGGVGAETKTRQLHIHTYLADRLDINDRGRKEANFSVLRRSSMSALLLEYMFIDNPYENGLLKKKSYRDYLGRLTAESIADSYNLVKK